MVFTISYNANLGIMSSWSSSAIKSPVTNFNASFEFPDIPLFSLRSLYFILSPNGCIKSSKYSALLGLPSAKHNSQFS